MLKQFISQLSKELELAEPLEPNDSGFYMLQLDPDLEIFFRENADSGITLWMQLGPLPGEKTEEFLIMAATANLFGKETGQCALGLDKEGKIVTLTSFVSADANYKDFHEKLEDFANQAESWKDEVIHFLEKENV